MSHLRFDGQGAGLGERLGGNANSLSDYSLVCTCKSELGPVMGFFPNKTGQRTAFCPRCAYITIIGANGQIAGHLPAPKEVIERHAASIARVTGK